MAEMVLGLGCLVVALVTVFALVFMAATAGVAALIALGMACALGWALYAATRRALQAAGRDAEASRLPSVAALLVGLAFLGGGIPHVNAAHLVFLPIMDLFGPDDYLGCRDGRSYAVYKGFIQSVNPACPCTTDRDCFEDEICDRFVRNGQKQRPDGRSRVDTREIWHWRLPASVPSSAAYQGERVCVPRAWTITPSPYFEQRLRDELGP